VIYAYLTIPQQVLSVLVYLYKAAKMEDHYIKYYCHTCHCLFSLTAAEDSSSRQDDGTPVCRSCGSEFVEQAEEGLEHEGSEEISATSSDNPDISSTEQNSLRENINFMEERPREVSSIPSETPSPTALETPLPSAMATPSPSSVATPWIQTEGQLPEDVDGSSRSQSDPTQRLEAPVYVSTFSGPPPPSLASFIGGDRLLPQTQTLTFFVNDPDGSLLQSLQQGDPTERRRAFVMDMVTAFLSTMGDSTQLNFRMQPPLTLNRSDHPSEQSDPRDESALPLSDVPMRPAAREDNRSHSQPISSTFSASDSIPSRRRPRSESISRDPESQPRRRSPRVMLEFSLLTAELPPSTAPSMDWTSRPTSTANAPNEERPLFQGGSASFSDMLTFASNMFHSFINLLPNRNTTDPSPPPPSSSATPSSTENFPFAEQAQAHRFQFIPIHFFPTGFLGDYALNDRSFDDIITHLLEQEALRHRPPSASDDIIAKLERRLITALDLKATQTEIERDGEDEGQLECIICKDAFVLNDPVIRLACCHIFHQDCLIPWLKQNGSCPTCRYSLVKPSSPKDSASSSHSLSPESHSMPPSSSA
jgi:hypothetical protein